MEKVFKKENLGIITLVSLLAVGVYIANKCNANQYMNPINLEGTLREFGVWAPLVFIALCTLRSLSLLPVGLFSFAGGFIFGFGYGAIYTYIGIVMGTFLAFWLSRYFGSGFVNNLLKRVLKGKTANVFLMAGQEKGFGTVLLLRIVPILPVDAVSYGMGLTNVSFKDYALATLLGMIHGVAAYVYMGSLARHITADSIAISILIYIVITVIPIVLAIRFNKIPIIDVLLKEALDKMLKKKKLS